MATFIDEIDSHSDGSLLNGYSNEKFMYNAFFSFQIIGVKSLFTFLIKTSLDWVYSLI